MLRYRGIKLIDRVGEERAGEIGKKISLSKIGKPRPDMRMSLEKRLGKEKAMKIIMAISKPRPKELMERIHKKRSETFKHHTAESKLKMSISAKRRFSNPKELEKNRLINKEIWNKPEYRAFARERRGKQVMPLNASKIEILIWAKLIENGIYDFITNFPLSLGFGEIHQADILFINSKVFAIELDGCYWHKCPQCFPNSKLRSKDEFRVKIYDTLKIKWLRFWEHEIYENPNLIVERIISFING
jgi:hypothetical protein